MKLTIKKLMALAMSMAIILSFISNEKLCFAESLLLEQRANIILMENKDGGIIYGNGSKIKLYKIANKGSDGFKIDENYNKFFIGDRSTTEKETELLNLIKNDNDKIFYVSYNKTSKCLEWRQNIDNKPYDFEIRWKSPVVDINKVALEFLTDLENTDEKKSRLAECLNDYASDKNPYIQTGTNDSRVKYTPGTENGGKYVEGNYTFSNLEYGYYLIDINIGSQGVGSLKIASNLVVLDDKSIDQQDNLVVFPKGKLPNIDKYIRKEGSLVKERTSQIGNSVKYTIVYDLPDLRNIEIANDTVYTIHDTMENQTMVENTLTMSIRRGPNEMVDMAKDGYYTLIWNDQSKKKFSIKLNKVALENIKKNYEYWKDYKIVLEYDAILDKDAKFENENSVYLEYGKNKTNISTVKVYTYAMNIEKKFSNGSIDFTDVEFKLYDETKRNVYKFVREDVVINPGGTIAKPARYLPSNEVTATDILKPDDSGMINIFGLRSGTYYLVETKTKVGFKTKELKVTIKPKFGDGSTYPTLEKVVDEDYSVIIQQTNPNNSVEKTDVGVHVTVVNSRSGLLPETGSIGTIAFTVVGLSIIAISLGMYKKEKNK